MATRGLSGMLKNPLQVCATFIFHGGVGDRDDAAEGVAEGASGVLKKRQPVAVTRAGHSSNGKQATLLQNGQESMAHDPPMPL